MFIAELDDVVGLKFTVSDEEGFSTKRGALLDLREEVMGELEAAEDDTLKATRDLRDIDQALFEL